MTLTLSCLLVPVALSFNDDVHVAEQLVDAAAVEQAGALVGDRRRRSGSQQQAHGDGAPQATDQVDADHVERVVVAELVLQTHSQGADDTGHGAEDVVVHAQGVTEVAAEVAEAAETTDAPAEA